MASPAATELNALCGARARLVWCQDAGDGADPGAAGERLRLMAFDSCDKRGERAVLPYPANYSRPMLTPDGSRIVYSDRFSDEIRLVDFDGTNPQTVRKGYALAVWCDRLTGAEWLYYGAMSKGDDPIVTGIMRSLLDKPEISEPIWSMTPMHPDNFQVSSDGRRACGLFPWPACGIAVLPNGGWTKFGDGCWPSLSPGDDPLFWIFDGAHRNLSMFRPGTGERWSVAINTAPGIDNFEVYHPRWSNHPRFMVMTGPYRIGGGENRIRAGGPGVEIYVGRFSSDYRCIERWGRVTFNAAADFYPDLWVDLRQAVSSGPGAAENNTRAARRAAGVSWPVSTERVIFAWQNRSRSNSFSDPAAGVVRVFSVEARGRARFGRNFEMSPSGGAFLAQNSLDPLEQCSASRQLALELMLTPSPDQGGGLRPIAGYAAGDGVWNFLLAAENNRTVFRLKDEAGGADHVLELPALPPGRRSHIIVACAAGEITAYVDGQTVASRKTAQGGNWRPGALVFGNELRASYPLEGPGAGNGWRGLIENAAVYARWIGAEEAGRLFRASASLCQARSAPELLVARVTVLSSPNAPSPESIAPYRRALSALRCRIEEVLSGTPPGREILVARWVVLDGQVLESARGWEGKTFVFELEPFDSRPELEGERLNIEGGHENLPIYYDTGG